MSTAIKKLDIVSDSSGKLANIIYEDGTTTSFRIGLDQGFFITVKNVGQKQVGKTHYSKANCTGLKMSSYHRLTDIKDQVTCALCKKFIRNNA